jgi:hypothetical protein
MLGIISVRPVTLRVGKWLLLAAVLFNNYYLGALSVVAPLVPIAKGRKPRQGQTWVTLPPRLVPTRPRPKSSLLPQPIFEIRACTTKSNYIRESFERFGLAGVHIIQACRLISASPT